MKDNIILETAGYSMQNEDIVCRVPVIEPEEGQDQFKDCFFNDYNQGYDSMDHTDIAAQNEWLYEKGCESFGFDKYKRNCDILKSSFS
jgi:hypothetical protein